MRPTRLQQTPAITNTFCRSHSVRYNRVSLYLDNECFRDQTMTVTNTKFGGFHFTLIMKVSDTLIMKVSDSLIMKVSDTLIMQVLFTLVLIKVLHELILVLLVGLGPFLVVFHFHNCLIEKCILNDLLHFLHSTIFQQPKTNKLTFTFSFGK